MKIPIQQAQPGMILDADVSTSGGTIIISGKQTITLDIINRLIKNGVSSVEISNLPESLNAAAGNTQHVNINETRNLPSIALNVDDNFMSATLIIEPSSQANSNLTPEDIWQHFKKQNITTGIDEGAIELAVHKWNVSKNRYEIPEIAMGITPEAGKEGSFDFKVLTIGNEEDLRKLTRARFMWELPELIPHVQRVIPDMVIAERQTGTPPKPGKTIKGDMVFTNQVIRSNYSLGKGASFSPDGLKIISRLEGVVYYSGEFIDVVHMNFDGSVEVKVSTDAMIAELLIHKSVDGGKMPDERQIQEQIRNANVIFGVKSDKINEIIHLFNKNEIPDSAVIIAEGIKPQHGQNGTMVFHFNTETSLKPKENADGSVDYKSVNIVNSIAKGQRIVSLSMPSIGVPGKNVYGDIVACHEGTPAKLPIGQNTEPDPANSEILIASVDGIVRYTGSVVDVNDGFIIKGSVDFSTGNVHYERSVVVNDDIKSGFEVDCGGDLQVGGTIEDCILKVGGNVLCRYGFSGQGKGVLDVKGDVNLGFMKNQTVRSCKNVNIAREAINSTIFAKNVIHIHGNPLSAAGGCITARDSIIVNTVGNHSGIRTLLEVGFDYTLGENVKAVEAHLVELIANQNKIIENLKKIDKANSMVRNPSLKDQVLKTKLTESLEKYRQQIQSMELRKKVLIKKMYNFDNAMIKIERSALPGTLFKFGERHYLVKEEIRGPKTARLIDHEIRVL